MQTPTLQRLLPVVAALAIALLGSLLPSSLQAQEAVPQISEEKLSQYAAAYIEIGDVRERINAEFARTSNKVGEAQTELRKRRQEEVRKIIEEKGLTPDEYERITWVLSVDGAQMDAFKAILARQDPDDAQD